MENVLWYITAASALCAVSSLTVRHYHFIYDHKNWTEAQSYCREHYTDLVTVDNTDVMNTLNKMVDLKKATTAWIGLYFDVVSWKWMLADKDFYQNDNPNFWNWMSGEPNSLWYTPGCGVMQSSGKWIDTYCHAIHKLVCSNVTGQNVAFVFINTLMNWTDAQRYCREHHTDLAIPRNLSENEKIGAVIPAGLYSWIGLYRDTWKWSDGPMYVFHRWTSGQPDGGEEKCAGAMFAFSGYWGNWPCYTRRPFICHHDSVPFTKQVVKVKLVGNSALDLNDSTVLGNLQEELKEKVKEQGVAAEVKLSWKKQLDGKIFYKEKKDQK